MARDARSEERETRSVDGTGLRVALVCGRFNDLVTRRLVEGARRGLEAAGVDVGDISETWVPGAFEIPLAAQTWAQTGRADAVICLGAVIRGETTHYDLVAGQCAEGVQRVALDTGIPIVFGVLATENLEQALARSQGAGGYNVGDEGAQTAIEMAQTLAAIRHPAG